MKRPSMTWIDVHAPHWMDFQLANHRTGWLRTGLPGTAVGFCDARECSSWQPVRKDLWACTRAGAGDDVSCHAGSTII